MQIPDGPNGFPTLSASQFRKYGTGGFKLESNEDEKGCPRAYHDRYVLKNKHPEEFSYPLVYGGLFHHTLFLMEDKQLTPDEAMEQAFEPHLPQEMWTELREDIENYLSRGAAPSDRYATVGVEMELTALLYIDEDFGPIYYRGFLDWVGVDPEAPHVIHGVDYKTNRQPAKVSDLEGDVQMRGYDWLITENRDMFVAQGSAVRVVMHLDVVKFNDVPIAYSRTDIEDWHSWAVAVARKILRDEEHEPILNTGCSYCPIRETCPAYIEMPNLAAEVAGALANPEGLQDPEKKLAWRDRANALRLQLEKGVKNIDEEFKSLAMRTGRVVVGGEEFRREADYATVTDVPELRRLLGEEKFMAIVGLSQTAVKKAIKDWDESSKAQVMACFRRELVGEKVSRKPVEQAR